MLILASTAHFGNIVNISNMQHAQYKEVVSNIVTLRYDIYISKATLRKNKMNKLSCVVLCIQIVRHAKTQNLVTIIIIKMVRKNKTFHRALNIFFVKLLID